MRKLWGDARIVDIIWTMVFFLVISSTGHSGIVFNGILSIFGLFCLRKVALFNMLEYGRKNILKICVLNFTLVFSLVGNNLFLYPIGEYSFCSILCFGMDYLLTLPLTVSLLYKLESFSLQKGKNGLNRKQYFFIFFVCFFVIELVYIIALNPGIVSWDDYHVIAEAKGLMIPREYEGLFYICVKRFLLHLCDEIWFLVLVQVIWADFVFSIIVSYFIKEIDSFINWRILVIASLFTLTLPNNSSLVITLSKDVPWAVSFVWLIYSIIRLKYEVNWYIVIEFSISMTLCWLLRQNGWIVVPFTAAGCLLFLPNRKQIVGGVILVIFLIAAGECTTRTLEYEPTAKGMKYIALFEDLLGVYYSEGNLNENTEKMIESVITPEFEGQYDPYWAVYETWREPLGKIPINEFVRNYLNTFLRNPIRILESIMLRLDMLWDVPLGVNGRETWQWQTYMQTERWKDLVPDRVENMFTSLIEWLGNKTTEEPFKEILWRAGAWLQICFFFMAVLIKTDRKNVTCFIPLGALLLFYILALGWEHYRYFWCIHLAALLYTLTYLQSLVKEDGIIYVLQKKK